MVPGRMRFQYKWHAVSVVDLNVKQVLYKSVNDESIGRAVNKEEAITEHSLYHLARWTHPYKMCFNTVAAKNAGPVN